MQHRQQNPVNTTVGAALEIVMPFGDYNESKLINLGGNRMVYRPQLGILHQRRNWQFELTGSVFLYGDNDEFWEDVQSLPAVAARAGSWARQGRESGDQDAADPFDLEGDNDTPAGRQRNRRVEMVLVPLTA